MDFSYTSYPTLVKHLYAVTYNSALYMCVVYYQHRCKHNVKAKLGTHVSYLINYLLWN